MQIITLMTKDSQLILPVDFIFLSNNHLKKLMIFRREQHLTMCGQNAGISCGHITTVQICMQY